MRERINGKALTGAAVATVRRTSATNWPRPLTQAVLTKSLSVAPYWFTFLERH